VYDPFAPARQSKVRTLRAHRLRCTLRRQAPATDRRASSRRRHRVQANGSGAGLRVSFSGNLPAVPENDSRAGRWRHHTHRGRGGVCVYDGPMQPVPLTSGTGVSFRGTCRSGEDILALCTDLRSVLERRQALTGRPTMPRLAPGTERWVVVALAPFEFRLGALLARSVPAQSTVHSR
jgi:hypothetical protein